MRFAYSSVQTRQEAGVLFAALDAGRFPPEGVKAAKRAINNLTLPDQANLRSDSAMFLDLVSLPETRERLDYLASRGLHTPGELERDLGKAVAEFR
ncbi:hypothetical protein [Streptomyces sp. NRRL B-3648]|uniref:hypothetical protein n=1 Tax=Streptomyces sp. NRRL B-3648 TaxID=1519493 RepID=UPI0006AF7522|nr:hypothetical protein [Streptomyces sp. NRRL B-3648]KOV91564.1 hypothetical protein ADL04_32915 [Streptomyces sp. NRRL B-3648]